MSSLMKSQNRTSKFEKEIQELKRLWIDSERQETNMTTRRRRKMKRMLRRVWGVILVVLIPINILSLFFMACCLDSDTIIPALIALLNVSYLLCIMIANDPYRVEQEKRYRREKHNEVRDKENIA